MVIAARFPLFLFLLLQVRPSTSSFWRVQPPCLTSTPGWKYGRQIRRLRRADQEFPRQQKDRIPSECWSWLESYTITENRQRRDSKHPVVTVNLEPLDDKAGFCNSLYRVVANLGQTTSSLDFVVDDDVGDVGILKIYSELAKARMSASFLPIGRIDQIVGNMGLGPRVLASSPNALWMEFFKDGCVLTEDQVHGDNNNNTTAATILQQVARNLAQLHSLLPSFLPNRNHHNMLWSSLEVLLNHIPEFDDGGDFSAAGEENIREYLTQQVLFQKLILQPLNLPVVVLGHGDLKPSNVMVLDSGSGNATGLETNNTSALTVIKFIDFETAGCHYRAFDLAKFFRTNNPTPWTEKNQELFLRTYLQHIIALEKQDQDGLRHMDYDDGQVSLLQLEAKLLIPMTWLEAAIFFHASRRPGTDWQELAKERIQHYKQSCKTFHQDVQAYRKAWQHIK